jgi:phospholipase/lecithinase/hemolysin
MFSEIVVFGDSVEDTGNVFSRFRMPPAPPYLEGRFSNGPVWVERLADRLDVVALRPSERGGTNYAWGGATTGSIRGDLSDFVDDIDIQVDKYLSEKTPGGDELFVLSGGGNDLYQGQTDVEHIVQFQKNHLSKLASAGAKSFLVVNVTRLAGDLSPQVNTLLSAELNRLRDANKNLTIYELDLASLFDAVVANPASFGFVDATSPACRDCGNGTVRNPMNVVPTPDKFLMWDDVHYTSAFHQILGDTAFQLLMPQPPALDGDYNADGMIDAADYVVWRQGLGTSYTQTDYDVWRAHFGKTAGGGAVEALSGWSASAEPSSAGVPEPAAWMLLLTAMLATLLHRHSP